MKDSSGLKAKLSSDFLAAAHSEKYYSTKMFNNLLSRTEERCPHLKKAQTKSALAFRMAALISKHMKDDLLAIVRYRIHKEY